MLVYFMAIWYILMTFGIFDGHLVYITVIWYILWPFGLYWWHLVYLMAIWSILLPFGIFCGHLVYINDIWCTYLWSFYIFYGYLVAYFSRFGMLSQEKSGNPGAQWKPLNVRICSERISRTANFLEDEAETVFFRSWSEQLFLPRIVFR
jgi:hypothetical protein